jgi:hypothetical protein
MSWKKLQARRQSSHAQSKQKGTNAYEGAMRRALARKPVLKTDGRFLSREESHDRTRLR